MLGDFEHEAVALIVGLERIQDFGQMVVELDVNHGAHDLAYMAARAFAGGDLLLLLFGLCDHG
jgi:hypothetical protein